MPAQTLRDYQVDAIRANKLAWERRNTRNRPVQALNSLATGGGKTTIFSQMIRETIEPGKQRALAFVHRREIVHQIKERIQGQFEELQPVYRVKNTIVPGIGVVMSNQNDADSRVIVSTVQSLHPERLRRMLDTGAFDLCIIDECHHLSAGSTYLDLVETLFKANPDMRLAGFTATPKRTDKKALAVGFDEIVFQWTILDGILGGYLVPATRLQVKSGVDLSGLPVVGGDYNHKKMLSVLEAANWLDLTFEAYKTYLQGRRGHIMAFMPSVQMSKQFVSHLQAMNVTAAHIGDDTPLVLRDEIMRGYKRGEIEVLSNFNVLTEGVDVPMTDAIIHARPTRSDTVLTQMVGRGLRLHPGKTDCLVLDLTVKDVKALQAGTLLGKLRTCGGCGADFYMGFPACPHCGWKVPEPDKRESDGDAPIVVNTKYKIMKGLEADVVPLLDQMTGAWYRHADEFMSVPAGEGALIIAPPTYADVTRQRERLMMGDSLLTELDDDNRAELLVQMKTLQREVERAERYTLFYVKELIEESDMVYGNGKTRRTIGYEVHYRRSNADLASLVAEADLEAMRLTDSGAKSRVSKDAGWRNDMILATDKQLNYLRRLAGSDKLPEPLTKDQAARMITHYKFTPRVKAHIAEDYLPERMPEYA